MSSAYVHEHRVGFDEVDAAGLAYFARFFAWCHDAMAAMLDPIEGGYAGLVRTRKLGFPAVHVEADYISPLRFGDEVHVHVHVEKAGRSSADLYGALRPVLDAARAAYAEQFLTPVNGAPDYLHQEIVRALANNDATLLGPKYPGPLA